MDRVLNDFIGLLRRHRVRVSPAEGLDALESLRHVGLGEREGVRDSLRTTLIKSSEDIETFERLFELFFGLTPEPEAPARLHPHVHDPGGTATELRFGEDLEGDPDDGDHDHSHAGPEPIDLRRFLDEEQLRPSHDIHGESERLRLSVFGQQLMLNKNPDALQQAMKRATHQLRVQRARSFHPGAVAPETGAEELPIELPAAGLDELVDDLRELGVDERLVQALAAQADDILDGLPELLEELLARRRKLSEQAFDDEEITRRSLRQLLDLSPRDQRELEAAIRRLGRQIHGARARRLRRDRVGKISVAHTLRRNLAYEGVPVRARAAPPARAATAAGGAVRRQPLHPQPGPLLAAPRVQPAGPVLEGAHVRVRRRCHRGHAALSGASARARGRRHLLRQADRRRREQRLRPRRRADGHRGGRRR